VQGLARGTGGARGRCEGDRDDRAPRDRGRGCRPDPCPRGGAGSRRRHRRHAARAHQGSGATLVSRGHRKARRHHRRASMRTKIKRALVSVYDKTGLVELARGLHDLGVELVSSGNTGSALEAAGIPVTRVEAVTDSPEMLDGRVKTLHPKIHGGLLADLGNETHRHDLDLYGIRPFELVVSNLYPFEQRPEIETIDIGGPAMTRAAAKNHAWVTIVTDPSQYKPLLVELHANDGTVGPDTRTAFALEAV